MSRSMRQKIRESRLAGYAYIALQYLKWPKVKPKGSVIFFPESLYTGGAGDLRAVAVARELRSLGWRTTIVPNWLSIADRQRILGLEPQALLFLQQTRHPLNDPKLYPGRVCVVDVDDADIIFSKERVPRILSECAAVIAGSEYLKKTFLPSNLNVFTVWTGTYMTGAESRLPKLEPPVLTWAQSHPLDYPHEFALMSSVWIRLSEITKDFAVAVYTTDREQSDVWLQPLRDRGITVHMRPIMRYRAFIRSLTQDAVGLQPICTFSPFSLGKSFGKVLAYLSAGIPVIATNELEFAHFFRPDESAILVRSGSEGDSAVETAWVNACLRLLQNPAERTSMARAAHVDFLQQLTTAQAAEKIDQILIPLIGATDATPVFAHSSDE